jgi:hypothetical protein
MEAITSQDAKEIKSGIVNIHRLLELRKLHVRSRNTGKMCGACNSFCQELGLQKQTHALIEKYHSRLAHI